MRWKVLAAAALVVVACAPASALVAQRPTGGSADSGEFLIRIGRDTLKYERFVIKGNHLHSDAVRRGAGIEYQTVDEILNENGSVRSTSTRIYPWPRVPGAAPVFTSDLAVDGDSTTGYQGPVGNVARLSFPKTSDLIAGIGASPIAAVSLASIPLLLLRTNGDSLIGFQVQTSLGRRPLMVRRLSPDSIGLFNTFLGQMILRVDSQGRVLSLDGTGGSLPFQAERIAPIDLDSAGRILAEMNRRATVGNILSPRDSVVERINGATIKVDYGRPSKRGRVIFGSIVQWNQVWRTGANLATHFSTDRALVLAGTAVPAGTYTLFTIPTPSGWTLIVSSEIGEWGTDYDPNQDFARIPMQVTTLGSPVEKFTIDIAPAGAHPALRFTWDTIQASIPIQVK